MSANDYVETGTGSFFEKNGLKKGHRFMLEPGPDRFKFLETGAGAGAGDRPDGSE